MASKRRILVQSPNDDEQEEEASTLDARSDRDIAIEGTWKEWFQRVFLKYCYALAVLFLACMLPLELFRRSDGDLGLGTAFLALLIIIPLGFLGYTKIWGKGGMWGPDELY